ncbi:hypothetical protein [Acinetobacter baumannii]|uniref:hypothetical protein n=1 Tax=Acinetobacter baumannii TaxID=470 RepID=UPI001177B9F3|nr:hypothetical protein [Acinetobacter baumannii]
MPTVEGIHLLYLEINKIFSLSCQPICNSALDKDFSAIKRNVDTEFNKLPKYVKPSKEQSINDALEFIKFSKQTFTDTMAQNEELLAEVKGFEKKANDVLEK